MKVPKEIKTEFVLYTNDVLTIRPDLSEEQAYHVLENIRNNYYDGYYDSFITNILSDMAEILFP